MYNKMSNKRMKRLLGNGFYLNVKFDQATAKKHRDEDRDFKQGYRKVQDWQLFDIKEGEILYGTKQDKKHNTRSHHSHVLSSLNGALLSTESDTELYSNYSFQGIAQTEHNAKAQLQIDQGLVSCVSGVITIINNYKRDIFPGDILYLHKPCTTKKNRGIHQDKVCFCLANLKEEEIAEYYWEILTKSVSQDADADADRTYESFLRFSDIDHRQVAKAMSRSKPGEKLDILLYPRVCSGISV